MSISTHPGDVELSDSISLSISKSRCSKDEGSKLGPSFGENSDVSIVETAFEFDVLKVREGLEEKSSVGRRGRDGARDDERSKHVFVGTFSDGLEEVGGVSVRGEGRKESSQLPQRRVETKSSRAGLPHLKRPSRGHLEAEVGEVLVVKLVVNEDGGLDPDEGGGCSKETRVGTRARRGTRKNEKTQTDDQRREGSRERRRE